MAGEAVCFFVCGGEREEKKKKNCARQVQVVKLLGFNLRFFLFGAIPTVSTPWAFAHVMSRVVFRK
jgi:hypothetical protein